jgi:D-glycero-beta-D-manno-heptose 1-phosphate adenylyltransferase
VPRSGLAPLSATLRARGKRIVSVAGSFDILHNGHVYILNEARRAGDVLVVGLRSDASVQAAKGSGRPFVPVEQRAEMLLALRPVDYVHIFDEPEPSAFLKALNPHVHVNGSEYGDESAAAAALTRAGGRVHIVDRLPGPSSADLAQRSRP